MKVTIGGREHIASASLLIPDGESAWLEFKAGTWDVKLKVEFESTDSGEGSFSLRGHDDHGVLLIENLVGFGMQGTGAPYSLGKNGDKEVLFMWTGSSIGGVKRIDISFFWGVSNV